MGCCCTGTGIESRIEKVKEARARTQLFLENEDPLVLEYPANLRLGIEQVAKDPSTGRARLQAGGQLADPGTVQAEGALLHYPLRADAIGEIALVGVDLLGGNLGGLPVEAARVIGTGRLAVAAANAPVVVDDDDPILLTPRRFDGTCFDARRVVAPVADHLARRG
mgnify:CR=1 FL=1